jgi:hypothetical protein
MDIFKLNRYFWDYAFENPEKIKPNHCAIYYFALEHCNRLGWKKKFGFPTSMVLEATGIKSYSVFKKTFDELVLFEFFEVIEYSKNQYSSNIIALKENYKALNKALDKASIKHVTKQSESTVQSTVQSIDSIDKHNTNIQSNNNTNNNIPEIKNFGDGDLSINYIHANILKSESQSWLESVSMQQKISIEDIINKIDDFVLFLETTQTEHKIKKGFIEHFINWLTKKQTSEKNGKQFTNSGTKKQFRFNTADALETLARQNP